MAAVRDDHLLQVCQCKKKQTTQEDVIAQAQDRQVKSKQTQDRHERTGKLRQRIADGYSGMAVFTPSFLKHPTYNRDQLQGSQRVTADRAVAAPFRKRFSPDDTPCGTVEERPQDRAKTGRNDYKKDHDVVMNTKFIAKLIYDYTSGYPVLVSGICKLIDEELHEWNEQGIIKAVGMLLSSDLPFFDSIIKKLDKSPEMRKSLYELLNEGEILYNPDDFSVRLLLILGIAKIVNGVVVIANRILETKLSKLPMAAGV